VRKQKKEDPAAELKRKEAEKKRREDEAKVFMEAETVVISPQPEKVRKQKKEDPAAELKRKEAEKKRREDEAKVFLVEGKEREELQKKQKAKLLDKLRGSMKKKSSSKTVESKERTTSSTDSSGSSIQPTKRVLSPHKRKILTSESSMEGQEVEFSSPQPQPILSPPVLIKIKKDAKAVSFDVSPTKRKIITEPSSAGDEPREKTSKVERKKTLTQNIKKFFESFPKKDSKSTFLDKDSDDFVEDVNTEEATVERPAAPKAVSDDFPPVQRSLSGESQVTLASKDSDTSMQRGMKHLLKSGVRYNI
jgi:hypothetical protein